MSDPFTREEIKAAQQKLSQARARACKKLPFMTDAIYALIPWATHMLPPGIGMGVRKDGVLFYDPKVINEDWDLEDTVTGTIHEAEHVLRKHGRRRERLAIDRSEFMLWNIAADAELGDDLEAMQCKLLETDITPKRLGLNNGQLAEVYFDQLKKKQDKVPCMCGSGAGNPFPDEDQFGGPVLESKAREIQLEQVREAVAEAVRTQGNAPAHLKRWAEREIADRVEKIPWEKQLACVARRAVAWRKGHTDTTFSRMGRRQAAVGFGPGKPIIPATFSPVPTVALVQDTSISMGTRDIAKTWVQAGKILEVCGGILIWVSIDAAVHSIGKVRSVAQMQNRLIGGGGTDFRPAFEQLYLMKPRPNVVVYCTDGYGTYPDPASVRWCKTIWLHTSRYIGEVPFGTVIQAY